MAWKIENLKNQRNRFTLKELALTKKSIWDLEGKKLHHEITEIWSFLITHWFKNLTKVVSSVTNTIIAQFFLGHSVYKAILEDVLMILG